MISPRFTWLRALVIAFYAMAVSALGFGHKAPVLPAPVGATGFAAHDATLLCLSHGGGDEPRSFVSHCDACLLTSAPGLPPAAVRSLAIAFGSSECRHSVADAGCPARFVDCGNRARAPPLRV